MIEIQVADAAEERYNSSRYMQIVERNHMNYATKRLPSIVGAVNFERAFPPIASVKRRGRSDLRTVTRQSFLPSGLARGA